MEMHRTGRTVAFSGGVSVLSWGSIGGKLEGQGPLGNAYLQQNGIAPIQW